ncbi:MAG: leucine-rich repeat domain-containing protein [Candidatus Poribacteria bacterium]|nr:leucine-rich repeat domain-containing protein [Candidatus Poribacteria bacterium]
MKHLTYICLVFFTCITVGLSPTEAQQNVAQDAHLILEQKCLTCHGPNGPFTEELIIESAAQLVASGAVVRGVPVQSELFKRLLDADDAKRMPLGQPRLSAAEIQKIGAWIQAGAPSWDIEHDVSFISTDKMLTTIQNHLKTLSAFDRPSARYFTTTHLYNAGEGPEVLRAAEIALSKLVNSLSWGYTVVKPEAIDAQRTVFYIDLRDYEWDTRAAWTQIETAYPYVIAYDATTRPVLHQKLTALREEMVCEVPFVHVDWFLAVASLPPLYHDILSLPETEAELERELGIDVGGNLRRAPGLRVMRSGTNDSGVSAHNRVVERHSFRNGAYWKSHDFASSVGPKNILQNPLSFDRDGGEVIFNLPNGLQAYYVSDGAGNRIDVAPTAIVSNPAASDPAVRNGLSCIGCHTEGMKTFEDVVRVAYEKLAPSPIKEQVLRLYVEKAEMDRFVAQDTARYRVALEATGGIFGGIEPVHRFHEKFQEALDVSQAAASVGLEASTFLKVIRENSGLQGLGLTGLLSGGNVKRDAWTANFSEIVACVYNDECPIPTPVPIPDPMPNSVERQRIIRDPSNLVPDVNLRAAIAEALGKPSGALLETEDLARLTELVADEQGISDLRGLEYAVKLERIELRHNAISDLSPLTDLVRLNNIKLRGNRITDVSPLAGLINVDWLGLEENAIRDLSPLAKLIKLNGLGIEGNPISDVSALSGLQSLEGIRAWNTQISDFSPLADVPRLRWLEVSNNRSLSSLSSLKGLRSLRRLEINNCEISDLSGLEALTQLASLTLMDNLISDISPLMSLKTLTHLNLRNNIITDVSPLSSLGNLEHLDLRNNAIADASPLETLINKGVVKWHLNPAFPEGGPMIKGPWLWVMLPDAGFLNGTDLLAETSQKKVTERDIATHGATEGNAVGNRVWTAHTLKTAVPEENWWDNLTEMSKALEWSAGRVSNQVAYGSILITSPRAQKTTMFVGSDENHKVWLNGMLVRQQLQYNWAHGYQEFFPVTLKQGTNVLLVAVHTSGGAFSGFFGFAPDTDYKVLPPGARFAFSTQTPRLSVGETLTLHVRAEKVTDLAGYQTNITFNPDVLKANGVREGGFLKQAAGQTFFQKGRIQNLQGEIRGIKTARLKGGVSGMGTLLSVTFTAIANGRTTVKLRNFQAGTRKGETIPAMPPEIIIVVAGRVASPAWDVNEDGVTDAGDLLLVTAALGQKPPKNPRLDVNGDGIVDGKDLALVAEHLGEGDVPAGPATLAFGQGFTPEMVEHALAILRAADDGTLTFKRGIAQLERLLAVFIPERTALLPNYPNPFNPETWIPYQLATPAEVTVSIYNVRGIVVRQLLLGHQPAGVYQSRSRAAYWDGRNTLGERVASGVYFYTLTAGDYTATRKLLIKK